MRREQGGGELRPEVVPIVQRDISLQGGKAVWPAHLSHQCRARHRDDALLHQQLSVQPASERRLPVAHGDVDAIGMEVCEAFAGQQAQIDVGVGLGEVAEPWNQPLRSKGRRHADRELGRHRAQQPGGFVDHAQGTADTRCIATPGIGQPDTPWQALEQAYLQAGFQPAHLLGDSRLGHAQLLGGEAEVQLTRHHFEHTQRIE